MGYSSGEFQIPWLWSSCQRGVAIFKNKLHVLGASYQQTNYMAHATFDLMELTKKNPGKNDKGLGLIDTNALKDPTNWSQNYYFYPPYRNNNDPIIFGGFANAPSVSLAANDTDLWGFYSPLFQLSSGIGPAGFAAGFMASKFDPAEGDPSTNEKWDSYDLLDASGASLNNMLGAASAKSFGATQFIVAAVKNSEFVTNNAIYLGLYDTNDIDTDKNIWKAQASRWLDINNDIKYAQSLGDNTSDPGFFNYGFQSAGNGITMDWFSTVENKLPSYYLAMSFTPQNPANIQNPSSYAGLTATAFLKIPLTADGMSISPGWGSDNVAAYLDPFDLVNGQYVTTLLRNESGIMRDPAGRLKSYAAAVNGNIYSRYFNSAQPPNSGNNFNSPASQPVNGISVGDGSRPASGVFFTYEQGKTEVTIQKQGTSGPVNIPADNYPVLEFTTYGAQSCQLNYYGDIRVARDTKQLKQKDADKPVYIIGGIIDGPPPFPLANYIGQPLAGDRADTGTFTYGNEDEIEQEISDESKWSVGFETSGEFTKGIGPAWDISFEGGMGSVGKDTKGTTLKRWLSTAGGVISSAPYTNPQADAAGAVLITAAQFHLTAYQFLDARGNMITDGLGAADSSATPKVGGWLATMIDGEPLTSSFEPYYITPGDLTTYTPQAINEKMAALGYTATDNYFGDIICANAYVWQDGQDQYTFREFTWSNGNPAASPVSVFKSTYHEQSWTYDGSIYAGISGGADIFDVEDFEAKFMVGVKFSKDHSVSNSSTSTWGLEISDEWGPLNQPDNPGSIQQFSFRVYFLPVPQKPSALPPEYWATELRNNLTEGAITKDQIDTGSACWRIAFVVSNIVYRDRNKHPDYIYDGSLDRASVYQNRSSFL